MEDRQTADFRVGLDFADEQRAAQIRQLLAFAEIPVATGLSEATTVLGDGSSATNVTVPYVYLQDQTTPGSDRIVAQLHLNSLMAAFAKAESLRAQNQRFPDSNSVFADFIGTSDAAVETRQMMATAAVKDVTVLVTGESGTGKEVVARALHLGSPRANGPFVPVNCGAIPAELLESELFGHEKGAFTGAITQKTGRFELAHGGTLFLDEIGDMPFAMQVKLLRAIEQKNFERVGGTQTRVSDARIVAATNSDLEAKVAEGEFREDLFYRLNVFPIELAPLRERLEDLPLLVNALLQRIQNEQGLQVRLSVDALNILAGYPWPGNVRELGNLLQRLSIQFPHGLVRSTDLPKKYRDGGPSASEPGAGTAGGGSQEPTEVLLPVNGIDLKDYLTRLEKSLIQQALEDTNAVVARAADRLHIRRTTLVEKMRKHGLNRTTEAMQ